MRIFFFQQHSAQAHDVLSKAQLLQHKISNFISFELWQPTAQN